MVHSNTMIVYCILRIFETFKKYLEFVPRIDIVILSSKSYLIIIIIKDQEEKLALKLQREGHKPAYYFAEQ
jgi:hypothetical protein